MRTKRAAEEEQVPVGIGEESLRIMDAIMMAASQNVTQASRGYTTY